MGKFSFSDAALDEGLTDEDVAEFDVQFMLFKDNVASLNVPTANAEQVQEAYASWLAMGRELFGILGKVVGAKALKTVTPRLREEVTSVIKDQLRFHLDRFRIGGAP